MALGLLGTVIGALWTVQGLGRLGGSMMTGEPVWVVIGPSVAVAGLVGIWLGLRARRRNAKS